jgi:hypothetical protein
VDAKIIGSSSLETKFLITCLIVSVDKTVEIPRRLPRSDDRVLLPVPDVPASNINMFLLDSKKLLITDLDSYKLNLKLHRNL